MKPEALFGRGLGFEIEVCPSRALTDDNGSGAVRFEVNFARSKVDVGPNRFRGIGVLLIVVAAKHFDDESGEYEIERYSYSR